MLQFVPWYSKENSFLQGKIQKYRKSMAPWQKNNAVDSQGLVHLPLPKETGGYFCSPNGLGDYVTLTRGQ